MKRKKRKHFGFFFLSYHGMGRQRHICVQTTPRVFQRRKSGLCSGLDLSDGTNTPVCVQRFLPPPARKHQNLKRHLGMGAEMMGGEETDHNIVKHLVKNYRWIIALSPYPALP